MTDAEWQQARSEGWREAREHYVRQLQQMAFTMREQRYPHGFAEGVALAAVKMRDGEL